MAGLLGAKYDEWMTPERSIKMGAYGDLLSGLGSGQQVNVGAAHQALQARKDNKEWKSRLSSGEFAGMFDERQMKALAGMPSAMAQDIIQKRMFAAPAARKAPVFQNGQWWDINGDVPQVVAGELPIEEPDVTADIENFQFYQKNEITAGRTPLGFQAWRLTKPAGTSVTVNNAAGRLSPPPPGQMYVGEGDDIRLVNIPGGALDIQADENARAATLSNQSQTSKSILMTDEIQRARAFLEEDAFTTTGPVGLAASLWQGSKRNDLAGALKTITGNLGFGELKKMRDSSPNGSAVGALSDKELAVLSSMSGSFELSQSAETLLYNLDRLQKTYDAMVSGHQTNLGGGSLGTGDGRTDADLEKIYGKP
jgi:hypothetical protein